MKALKEIAVCGIMFQLVALLTALFIRFVQFYMTVWGNF